MSRRFLDGQGSLPVMSAEEKARERRALAAEGILSLGQVLEELLVGVADLLDQPDKVDE